MRLKKVDRYFYLLGAYIVILHLCPFLGLLNMLPGGKPAYIVDTCTILPIILAMSYIFTSATKAKMNYLDYAVLSYLIISILSVLLYLQPDNPSDMVSYFYGLHHFVLPIFLYFAVKSINFNKQYSLLRFIFYLNIAAVVIGIILFFWRPDFYQAKLRADFVAAGMELEDWQIFGRMQSYLGSTALGSIISTSLVLLIVLNFQKKQMVIFLPILTLGVLLTSQRGGFIAALIALIYTFIKIRGGIGIKIVLPITTLLFLFLGLTYYLQIEPDSLNRLFNKYSLNSLIESFNIGETRGYKPGFSYIQDYPMGVGLGATSSIADSMGLAKRGQVVDANFMRIFADLGIVGLLSFLVVLGAATRASFKRENGFGWFLLFGLIAAICIGTNTLDSYYVSHSFWIYLGVIGTKSMRKIVPKIEFTGGKPI